jgi:hypothetical protein
MRCECCGREAPVIITVARRFLLLFRIIRYVCGRCVKPSDFFPGRGFIHER